MTINKVLQLLLGADDTKAEGFLRFMSEKLWALYNEYIMDKVKMAENAIKWELNIPNAKENQAYDHLVKMPGIAQDIFPGAEIYIESVKGLDEAAHGLRLEVAQDKKSFSIKGTPTLETFRKDGAKVESTFCLKLTYRLMGIGLPEGCAPLEKDLPFIINQDPRKLWKYLPVDWESMSEPKYKKEDTEAAYVKVKALPDGTPQKDIVAASKRGRSHAQEAKPRDDHFRVEYLPNGWYVMAVADGAGSAKFSRKGSEIACNESVSYCMHQLSDAKAFEDAIAKYDEQKTVSEAEARKTVGNLIYGIVGKAAFRAHKAVNAEAAQAERPPKEYATTLLLSICKKFPFGWFVASFWVGDGAICLYDRKGHTAKILGIPDEGDYAGQTRFLTMQEIFSDTKALYKRLRFCIVDDFTALFLMTDGVTDPKFETDANLNNPDKWDDLWDDLRENGVQLTDDNEAAKGQLLDWLDFWAPGNHDDRTIAILYEGETLERESTSEQDEASQETLDGADENIVAQDKESADETTTQPTEGSTAQFPPPAESIETGNEEGKE